MVSLEKAMAPHSSTLAWKVLWVEEPGRLQSMGLLKVEHDRATSLSLFTFMHWRRKWQPTPVFLPGESQGWGSLVGYCLWGCTESDTTEATYQTWFLIYNSVEKLIGWIVVLTWHLYALTIEKNSYHSLYCNICCIVVVCNQTHNIPEVY